MDEVIIQFIWIALLVIVLGISVIAGIVLLFKLIINPVYIVDGKKIRRATIIRRKPGTFMVSTLDGISNINEDMVFGTKEEAAQFIIDREKANAEEE